MTSCTPTKDDPLGRVSDYDKWRRAEEMIIALMILRMRPWTSVDEMDELRARMDPDRSWLAGALEDAEEQQAEFEKNWKQLRRELHRPKRKRRGSGGSGGSVDSS
jgi:hypothetical protein